MDFNDYSIEGKNGKREKLKDIKHGIRREQIDAKLHNLFDAYDANKDGTLETDELTGLNKSLSSFAGADKVLDNFENTSVGSVFSSQLNLGDADFMGFVKSVSDASEDIESTEETLGEDGGKIITTKYKNGLVETLYYYPDGEYKMKEDKLDTKVVQTSYILNGLQCSKEQLDEIINNAYKRYISPFTRQQYFPLETKITFNNSASKMSKEEFKQDFIKNNNILPQTNTVEKHIYNSDLSDRAKHDASVRDFVISHFVETHKECKAYLDEMGIFSDAAAAINASVGEIWNLIKNKWNGTDEEYKNFYELLEKFDPDLFKNKVKDTLSYSSTLLAGINAAIGDVVTGETGSYDRALKAESSLEGMRQNNTNYFKGFNNALGTEYSDAKGEQFYEAAYRFQTAQGLTEKLKLLKGAINDLASAGAPVFPGTTNIGMNNTESAMLSSMNNPASKLMDAKAKLAQFFDGDNDLAEAFINDVQMGTFGNYKTDELINIVNGLKETTETNLKNILGEGKTLEDAKADYMQQYKELYNTDFVPEELVEKVGGALETGGMIRLGVLTAISYLLTKSPVMSGAMEALGASRFAGVLVSKFGQQTASRIIQEAVRFTSMSTTIGIDAGLNAVEQLTSEAGISGDKMLDGTLSAAKFIGFSTYIGGPLAQAVSKMISRTGSAAQLFTGGTKTVANGVETTVVSGEKLTENLMKGGSRWNRALAAAGGFATDVGAFTALEVATEGTDLADTLGEQGEFLGKLKIMNHVIEYMLGKRTHAGFSKAKMDLAIERSGIKNWDIAEIKDSKGTKYSVSYMGIPLGEFKDVNTIATAMMERVSKAYETAEPVPPKAEDLGDRAEVENKTETTDNRVETKPATEPQTEPVREEIAPFAERLTRTPGVEELTNPEIKKVTLENGEFNEQGEFVSDGTKTVVESGNPLAKPTTYRIYPEGEQKIAQTFDEFVDQICEITGKNKKDIGKWQIKQYEQFFKNNPDVSVADVSEVILDYMHATGKSIAAGYRNMYTLSIDDITQINDFKTFKTNIEEFDTYMTELKEKSRNDIPNRYLQEKLQGMRAEYFTKDMAEIKPEEFKKNLDYFRTLDTNIQQGLTKYDYNCLFEAHDSKYFENIGIANDYNKWVCEYMEQNGYNKDIPLYGENALYLAKYDNAQIEQIKKNIELVKEMIADKSADYRLMSDILFDRGEQSNYTDLAARLKAELGENFSWEHFSRMPNKQYIHDEAQFDISIELTKALPEGVKTMGSWGLDKLTAQYLKADEAGKQNMKDKIAILQKLPEIAKYANKYNSDLILKFLSEKEIPHADKIVEFLNLADPEYLSRVQNQRNLNLSEMFPPDKIDGMIECAKLHSELPKELVDYMHTKESIVGQNMYDVHNMYQYEVESQELRASIDVINKYKDKFAPANLERIYLGKFKTSDAAYEMLSEIDPAVREVLLNSYQMDATLSTLDNETLTKFKNWVNNCDITPQNIERLRYRGINDNIFKLFTKFTPEELDTFSFEQLTGSEVSDINYYIENIKNTIAITPKQIRDLIKEDAGFNYYADYKKTRENSTYPELIERLVKLSDADLKSLGSKVIIKYIDINAYSIDHELNPRNIELWRQVPQEVKDKFGVDAFYMLTSENAIDVNAINNTYNRLKEQNALETINGNHFKQLLDDSTGEIKERVDNILNDPDYDRGQINNLIYTIRQNTTDFDFLDELINNPKLSNNDIAEIYGQLSQDPALAAKQKDFVRYLIERDDVDNYLIGDLIRERMGHSIPDRSIPFDKNTKFIKELLDNPNIENSSIYRIARPISSTEFYDSYKKLATDLINSKRADVEDITNIIDSLRNGWDMQTNRESIEAFKLADRLLKETDMDGRLIHNLLQSIKGKPQEQYSAIMDFIIKYKDGEIIPVDFLTAIVSECGNNENQIKTRLTFAEELAQKIDAAYISDIISNIETDGQIQLAREMCSIEGFQKGNIAQIIDIAKTPEQIAFARELCLDKDFPKIYIANIITFTKTPEQINFAKRLSNANDIPKDKIFVILNAAYGRNNNENQVTLENLFNDEKFPNKYLDKVATYLAQDKNNADNINKMLSSPEMENWFIKNIENDLDIETIFKLSRTQKQLYNEAKNVQNTTHKQVGVKSNPKPPAVQEAKPEDIVKAEEALVSVGVHPKMAPNYVKMCQENGIVDKVKLEAVCALAQVGVPVKEIKNIFNLAVGNSLSNADGIFRPDIIKDIVTLKQNGVEDIKLAANIAAVRNMAPLELKGRINTKIRQDLINRINALDPEIKQKLAIAGIDTDMVIEKASAEPKGGKVKQAEVPKIQLRSLDSIVGVEKIIVNKYKNEIDQNIWGDPVRFRAWAEERLKKVLDFEQNPNYTATGQFAHFNDARKQGVENWYKFLKEESNYKDDVFVHLLVMEGITSEMKPNNAYTPPAVSHESFEATYNALIQNNTKVSFNDIYTQQTKLKAIQQLSKGVQTIDGIEGQWVTIPRSQRGEPNYDEHIAMVQALAEGSSWCLRFENAHNYLQGGNLHFFVDKNGNSQVAINETNGKITQIQKRYKQDSSVPVPYANVIETWARENNYTGLESSRKKAIAAKPKFDEQRAKFAKLQQEGNYLEIFKELGITVTTKDDGTSVLNSYNPMKFGNYTLFDLGINEDKLMENVSEIHNDLNLDGSSLHALPKLRVIRGILTFGDNKISDLRSLEELYGKKIFWDK